MADGPTPEVSVIFPVYNVREFVANSLGTVQDQTFENIEIICVIDGATDDSADIIESTFRDSRIRIIHQENRGLGGARNTGIRAARAPWITFVDSDDWLHPRFVEALLTKAREGYDIVDCLHNVIDPAGGVTARRQHTIEGYDPAAYFRRVVSARVPTNACARLYRASLFDGLSFPEHTVHEDVFTVWKLYQRAQRAVTINEALYNWLARSGSLSRSVTTRHIDDVFSCFDDTEASLHELGEFKATLEQHYRRCYHFAAGLVHRIAPLKTEAPDLHADLVWHLTAAMTRSHHFHSKSLASVLKTDAELIRSLETTVNLNAVTLTGGLAPVAAAQRGSKPARLDGMVDTYAAPADPIYTITFAGLLLMAYRKLRLHYRQRRLR